MIKFNENVERVLIVVVGILCVLIPLLDFVGVFENVEWFHKRLHLLVLFSVGLLTTYLVSHLNNKEHDAIERHSELLRNIKLDDASARFKSTLETLWNKREMDINKLFAEVDKQTQKGTPIETVLRNTFTQMISGNFFGTIVGLPWDFTLAALNYEGVIIYHPGIPQGHRLDQEPALTAVKERNGTMFLENELSSEQLGGLFPQRAPGKRFTKVYFKDFPDLKAIVVLESHINIIDKLPPIKIK